MRIPDYYVRFVDFPPTVLGATLPNDDGTFSVYINARLGDDARRETLRHELEHMARDHFYRDAPVAAQEAEARGETVSAVPPAPERGTVRCYRDLAALTAYLRSLGALGSSMESLGAERCGDKKSQWHTNAIGSLPYFVSSAGEFCTRSRRAPARGRGACPH